MGAAILDRGCLLPSVNIMVVLMRRGSVDSVVRPGEEQGLMIFILVE